MSAQPSTRDSGQILISILIAIAVFAILSHALFTLIGSSYQQISYNRARTVAKYLAQKEIETIRNLDYDDIGTLGGTPNGNLPQTKTTQINGNSFTTKTAIIYIDDPADEEVPADLDGADYKRVRIEVSWRGLGAARKASVILITDISPPIATSVDGGTLRVVVTNANNDPVSGASVKIAAPSLSPAVDITQTTGATGIVTLPGMQACNSCYRITVTKTGYSTDRTYASSEITNPMKSDVSISISSLTQMSFAIDQLGDINIASVDTRDNGFIVKPGIPFRIHGNKIIGTDALGKTVYKYDKNFTTDAAGIYSLPSMEWDIYTIDMPETTTYDIAGSTPILPINLTPGGNISLTFSVKNHTDHSVLTIIRNSSQELLENVNLRLYDDLGFSEATTSGKSVDPDFGQNLFSNLNDTTIYHLEATASGYINKTKDVFVSGYTVDQMTLSPE
jgi:type II secretory pathway pseudopilin PulG